MTQKLERTEFIREQAKRTNSLFSAIVLAALDDAIASEKRFGNGPQEIAHWARSRDGQAILTCAGIDPSERVVQGLIDFVTKGVRVSVELSRERYRRTTQVIPE